MAKKKNHFDSSMLLSYMFPKDMLDYFEVTDALAEHPIHLLLFSCFFHCLANY